MGRPRQVPAEPFIQVPLREYDGQPRPARAGRRGEPPGTAERPPLALPRLPRPSAPPPRARRALQERGSAAGGDGRGPGGPRYRGRGAALCRPRGRGPGRDKERRRPRPPAEKVDVRSSGERRQAGGEGRPARAVSASRGCGGAVRGAGLPEWPRCSSLSERSPSEVCAVRWLRWGCGRTGIVSVPVCSEGRTFLWVRKATKRAEASSGAR